MANEKRILVWRTGSRVVNVLKIEDVDECCRDEDGLHAGKNQLLISRRMWSSLIPSQFLALYPSIHDVTIS